MKQLKIKCTRITEIMYLMTNSELELKTDREVLLGYFESLKPNLTSSEEIDLRTRQDRRIKYEKGYKPFLHGTWCKKGESFKES